MSEAGELVHLLRNLPVSEFVKALERAGFTLRRSTRTGGRIYMHEDGRLTVVHYHHGSDTPPARHSRACLKRWDGTSLTPNASV